jgi:hypothetical protein
MRHRNEDRNAPEAAGDDGGIMETAFNRRNFLAVAGIGGAAVVAVAATGIPSAGATVTRGLPSQATTTMGSSAASGDAAIAKFAASLEVLAAGAYTAVLDAATAGKLGPVPPAGAEFATTALAQHNAQLAKWNEVLAAAGQPAVTTPDPKLKAVVDQTFPQVKDFGGAAKLALLLEETAAATYLKAIPSLQSKDARKLAGSIQIIDAQHAAILHYVLGEYPVPDTFAKTDMAASPS